MKLCFGTFMKILDLCKYNITQENLITEIIRTIDDPKSRYITSKEAISKLKNCKIDYVFYSGNCDSIPSQNVIIQNIRENVSPYIDEDKKATVMLMLLYIIQNESKTKNEKNEYFKKYFGVSRDQLLTQSEFQFSDFLCKVLLYTLCSNINNKIGEKCVKAITDDFINEKISPYKGDYVWESSTETLTLSFRNAFIIFDEALDEYTVRQFIAEKDPMRGIDEECIENCENFNNFIHNNILVPFSEQSNGKMLKMIHDFSKTLNTYIDYLGYNMKPVVHPSIWVPNGRKNNFTESGISIKGSNYKLIPVKTPTVFLPDSKYTNPNLAKTFSEKTYWYRQHLKQIYTVDIHNYIFFKSTN